MATDVRGSLEDAIRDLSEWTPEWQKAQVYPLRYRCTEEEYFALNTKQLIEVLRWTPRGAAVSNVSPSARRWPYHVSLGLIRHDRPPGNGHLRITGTAVAWSVPHAGCHVHAP